MSHTCREIEDRLLADAGEPRPADLVAHLRSCASCGKVHERLERLRAALSSLPRLPSPGSLDGAVVAAFHAGHRQERAASAILSLGRRRAPAVLESGVLGRRRAALRAPAVLERLVEEELRDPEAAMARRFDSRLRRVSAPESLLGRIEGAWRAPQATWRRPILLLAAAAVVVLLGVGVGRVLRSPGAAAGTPRGLASAEYEVHHEATFENLDPMARSMLAALSGGLVDAHAGKEKL